MEKKIIIDNSNTDKTEVYLSFIQQIEKLIVGESDKIANIGNILSALKHNFNHLWVGVYLVRVDELILHLFQGPVACTRIAKGKGVCGAAWHQNKTIIVPDVNQFPGHIACSSESQSEIVLPLRNDAGEVVGVLDIDSEHLNRFDRVDEIFLTTLATIIEKEYAK